MKRLRSIAFQRCIIRGGLPLVELSQNEDFLQKTASKTGFLRDTKLDQLTLEGAGTPNFKSTDFFTCSLKTLGQKLSDELSGSPLASKLSDRRPLEIFLGAALKKCKNRNFLLLLLLLENFVKKNSTRIGPCERARTQLSEYV